MATWDLIGSGTFNTTANLYNLTGIPGGYTDLVIIVSNLTGDANSQLQYSFNNNVDGSNYYVAVSSMNMNASVTNYTNNITNGFYAAANYGVGQGAPQVLKIEVGQYASSQYSKTFFGRGQAVNNNTSSYETTFFGGTWTPAVAITSFQIRSGSNLYSAKIDAYGIKDS